MPRRREVPRREILPDPLYSSVEVSKFVNVLMLDGKKAVAERMLYGALEQIKSRSGKDPLEVFGQALHNVRPMVEVKAVGLAAPTTRCLLRFARYAARRLPCGGSARPQRSGARNRWVSAWPMS